MFKKGLGLQEGEAIFACWREKEKKTLIFFTKEIHDIQIDVLFDRVKQKYFVNKKLIKQYLKTNSIKMQALHGFVKKCNVFKVEQKQ